jgi:hypothetical protein
MLEPKDIIERYKEAIATKHKCKASYSGIMYENGEHWAIVEWNGNDSKIVVRPIGDEDYTVYVPGREWSVTRRGEGLEKFLSEALR